MYRITLVPGDGVGPEITEAARRCIEATGVKVEWEVIHAGGDVVEEYGTPLPQHLIDSIRANGVALKGPITTPIGTGFRSVNVALRKALDLFAGLRPCRTYPGVRTRFDEVNLVTIRENTEGLYAGVEHIVIPDQAAESIRIITRRASERIVRFAFDYARQTGRHKVTAVHKANILKLSDGLFLDVACQVAQEYPDIAFEDRIIDNMCMQLVQKPELYDILVLPNLYGDIVSDLCAGLVGGLGVAPAANVGDECAVFEAVQGSAPKYAGLNKVNPTAMILTAVLMLRHLGQANAADRLERAVAKVIAEGKAVTYDLKSEPDDPTAVGTREMADAIIEKLVANS